MRPTQTPRGRPVQRRCAGRGTARSLALGDIVLPVIYAIEALL